MNTIENPYRENPYSPKSYRLILTPGEIDETLEYMYYVAVQHHYLQTRAPPPHHLFIERVCDDEHPLVVACYSIGHHCAFPQEVDFLRIFVTLLQEILDVGTLGAELNREMEAAKMVVTQKVMRIVRGEEV